jgi:predicted N-acetyltransferase YhbS
MTAMIMVSPLTIRTETAADVAARECLLDRCFGEARFLKTCERLREGRLPAEGLALTAADAEGRLVGTLRLWHATVNASHRALLLGPLAVAPELRGAGLGAALMREGLARAEALGHAAVLLVGNAPYYARFGFSTVLTETLSLPGPYERERFLALELVPGALAGASGLVIGTGALLPASYLPAAVAQAA